MSRKLSANQNDYVLKLTLDVAVAIDKDLCRITN
jgi:hypothetical protein